MHYAIIDLGSNSIRFEIYQQHPENLHPELCYRERFMPRLGDKLSPGGCLNEKSKALTFEAFNKISAIISQYQPCSVHAVGTSALREAADSQSFLDELTKATAIQVRVISGEEEARLTALGILSYETNIPERCALMDIGGGSTEISLCERGAVLLSCSLPVGAVRGQSQTLKSIPPAEHHVKVLRAEVLHQLNSSLLSNAPKPFSTIIGSSGTIRMLCSLNPERRPQDQTRETVSAQVDQLSSLSLDEIQGIAGMEDSRADIFLAGIIILEEVMLYLESENIRASAFSLRHGLLKEAQRS